MGFLLLFLLMAVIGLSGVLLFKLNAPEDLSKPVEHVKPSINDPVEDPAPALPTLPVAPKPSLPEHWTDTEKPEKPEKHIKGLYIINECNHHGKHITLYTQYNNGTTWTNGSIEYGQHSGIIPGSNTWNIASGHNLISIGWLDNIEWEGNYKIHMWASPMDDVINLASYIPVDGYETFIGYGEGSDIININDTDKGPVNVIDAYYQRYLNGDGKNYYFYIRISDYA